MSPRFCGPKLVGWAVVVVALTAQFVAPTYAQFPIPVQVQHDGRVRWPDVFGRDAAWYAGAEAVRIADNVLLYQHRARLARERDEAETIIDNGATHTQIRFLAMVHQATDEPRFADGSRRGIEFVLAAQYPNGGWPMIFPLQRGYYSHITFNDGAMIGVMRLLRAVAAGEAPYDRSAIVRRRRLPAGSIPSSSARSLSTASRPRGARSTTRTISAPPRPAATSCRHSAATRALASSST
jgi:hypothetical protein